MAKTPPATLVRAAVELLRRYEWEKAIRSELSAEQLAFHDSPHHLNANHSGRRRGKSEFIPRSAILNALRAPRGVDVVIVGESKLKARLNLNNKLAEVIHRHQLPFTFNGMDTCWTAPWGARIIFAGLDSDGEIKKLLGYKLCVVYADECDTFASRLVEFWKAISPALSENGGRCFFVGTPSLTRSGGWFEICAGRLSSAWKVVNWATNPFYKVDGKTGAEALETAIQQYCVDNGVARDSDEVKRVWFGQFVNDIASRVYAYDSLKNTAQPITAPAGYAGGLYQWMLDHGHFTIGVDFGTKKDACAWTVLWSQNGSDVIHVIESQKHFALLPDDASAITKSLGDKYKPTMIVGDPGGLGAPYIEVHNLKYGETSGYFINPATKLGKHGAISLLNGELRSGRILLHEAAAELAKEMLELPWHDPMKRDREHEGYANHCTDSCLYAYRDHQVDRRQAPSTPSPEEQAVLDSMARKRAVTESRNKHWQTG